MVNAENEISFAVRSALAVLAFGLANCKFISTENVFRTEIARADAVTAAENARDFVRGERGQCAAKFRDLVRFAKRGADIARERVVAGETFVGALDDDDVL